MRVPNLHHRRWKMTTAPPILLTGPTAVGKSAVALRLAERLGGEIISVDSMQVYRGLDLGTAKPTPAERARVPHHLVDILDLRAPFDAAQFVARAQAAVRDIQARGRRPVFCGGTGLYFKAWLEGLGESPAADAVLRAELEAAPLPDLLVELAAKDPVTFAQIDQQNPRRVVRAVEVIRLTGRPYSEQRAAWGASPAPAQAGLFVALRRAPEDLRVRVHRRVDEMFGQGLVAETRLLLAEGLAENRTAMQAIGYRQVVEHLRGERGLAETIALVKTKTWQYAKRQMTWLRHQAAVEWMDWPPEKPVEAMVEMLAAAAGV
jgi:tRNA dimethylallyltransferase